MMEESVKMFMQLQVEHLDKSGYRANNGYEGSGSAGLDDAALKRLTVWDDHGLLRKSLGDDGEFAKMCKDQWPQGRYVYLTS